MLLVEKIFLSQNIILKSDNCTTKGDKISIAPIGDGTPQNNLISKSRLNYILSN